MKPWLRRLLVLLCVGVCLGPALAAPTRWFVGSPWIDGYGTQWFYWFAGQVLEGKQSFEHTNLLFYPWGKDVYLHTGGNLLDAWLALPLRLLLGPILGYNLWCGLILAGNYLGGTRLAAALGAAENRQWTAGLVLVLNPYVLMELQQGRPTQAFLLWPALAAAGLWRLGRPETAIWSAPLVGLAMAASGLQYWYYGLLLGGLALVYGSLQVLAGPNRGRSLLHFGIAALLCLGITVPFALQMLEAIADGHVPGLLSLSGEGPLAPLAFQTREGEDIGLFVLNFLDGTSGSLLENEGILYSPGDASLHHLWPLWLGLGLWSLRAERGRLVGLLGWSLLTVLVATGPAWVWGGKVLTPNAPYLWLLETVPVLQRWWWPGRAVFALWLLLAGLLPRLLEGARWKVGVISLILTAVGFWELRSSALFPLDRWDGDSSPVLRCLRAAPDGAVIGLPYIRQQESLYFQTIHQKPLLGGMLVTKPSFRPAEMTGLLQQNHWLSNLIDIGQRDFSPKEPAPPEERQAILDLGYRYLVAEIPGFLRPKPRRDGSVEMVSDWGRARRLLSAQLGKTPDQEDDRFALWNLNDGSPCAEAGPTAP